MTVHRTVVALPLLLAGFAGAQDDSRTMFDYTTNPLTLTAGGKSHERRDLTGPARDLSNFTRVELDVENPGDEPVHLAVKLFNENGRDWFGTSQNVGFVRPKTRKTFNVFLYRPWEDRNASPLLKQFSGMNGLPGGLLYHWRNLDTRDVRTLHVELLGSGTLHVYTIKATHPLVPAILKEKGKDFFPFVDTFGQYRWDTWPGKVSRVEEMKTNADAEAKDLAAHPRPADWSPYGGWAKGPKQNATGFFRTEKIDGKWWLVDPDGWLFWSHGVNCVGYDSGRTLFTRRENYFADLPAGEGPYGFVYSQQQPGNDIYVDFVGLNLARTFGPDWKKTANDLAHARLASWRMNTIGAWSSDAIEQQRRTPYTRIIHPQWPSAFDRAPDAFAPDFAERLDREIARGVTDGLNDPWCAGYFVDNELEWGNNPRDFIAQLLRSGASHTRTALMKTLREKYGTTEKLNAAFGTSFDSFDAFEASRVKFKSDQIPAGLDDFYADYCRRYFAAIGSAMKKHAPNQLYLGCRMHVANAIVVNQAAKQCDVLSFNLYQPDVNAFRPPGDVDKPALVSEFHFGALDHGFLSTGLQPASDQQDRADKYRYYVTGALRNPSLVGTHWFAYCPQSVTGRGDNENHETGLFDTTGLAYDELRAALRDVGETMYETRRR